MISTILFTKHHLKNKIIFFLKMLTFNYLKNNTKFKVLFGQKLKKKKQQKTKAKTKCRSDLLPKSHFKNQQYQFKKHLNIYRIFKKKFPTKKRKSPFIVFLKFKER